MGVTIDNLQIEIQSDSIGAAKGIDALAKSLEGLKKNGSFKTVSNNLNNLSKALQGLPNVHQASNSLRTLANSIEKLKGVGTVASLSNSLKKLPEALKSISNINIEKVAPQLQSIANAVQPLTQIKSSGFSSMVNSMAKIEKVTDSLDSEKIAKFAAKMRELSAAVEPFSAKMGTIATAFKGLNTAIKQTNVSIDQANTKVNVATLNFDNFMSSAQHIVSVLSSVQQGLANVIDGAAQWDGIATRFGKGFGEQAQETYAWIQRLNKELGINIQQFMQYSSTYATMLKGFGVAQEDSSKMALGYMELTYDIWAAHNDMYKTLDDAAEAVRSAIAGEVEPVRRAGFTIIESTLQETAANHGLAISLETATEAQKSYLRYLTMVDQARATQLVGTYAKELNTAEGVMRTLQQQLKSLSQAFGSLFLPILVKVVPWVQALVELLSEGVRWLAAFFGIEIQAVDFSGYGEGADAIENVGNSANDAAGALEDATQAAKELKNATLGIDELNVISPSSATSGSGGSSGSGSGGGIGGDGWGDIDSLWDEAIFDNVQSKVGEIKEKLKGMFEDILPIATVIGGALGAWSIAKLVEQLGTAIGLSDNFFGKIKTIKDLAMTAVLITVSFAIQKDAFGDFMGEDGTILDYIKGVLIGGVTSYLLYARWGVGGLAIGLGVTAIASLSAVLEEGGITDLESATVAITGLATAMGALATAASALSKTKLGGWFAAFIDLAKTEGFIATLLVAFPKLTKLFGNVGAFLALLKESGSLWGTLAAAFPKIANGVGAIARKVAKAHPIIYAIVLAITAAITFLTKNWKEFTQAVKDFFAEKIAPKIEKIKEQFAAIGKELEPLKPVFDWLKVTIPNVVSWISNAIGTVLEWIGGLVVWVTVGPLAGLIQSLVESALGVAKWAKGVIEVISGLISFVKGIFTLDGDLIVASAKKIGDGIVNVFKGLWQAIVTPIGEFFDGVIYWFKKLWDILVGHSIVPDTINAIVEWFTSLPSRIFGSIQNFATGIVDRFKGIWASLQSWWNNKGALKEYTPSIGSIKDKLSSAWTSAKTWWDSKKAALKSYTPSIGSIYEKVKERWDSARTWWNDKKTKMKEYTPSIGSIYEKVYDRWKNARDWWNSKKSAMNSYTPSIGSITDKIKSAWNSAKSWWNKNVGGLTTKLNVQVPTISVKWDTATAFGKSFKYPTGFSLKFAANGGIFDQGSLIWAGERGPEIMANAGGGKTGVMNVQQMQDAVYEGVYAAVSAAMRNNSGGGSQEVKVYLDGRQITSAVEQRQHERGASIMGNEVYSY